MAGGLFLLCVLTWGILHFIHRSSTAPIKMTATLLCFTYFYSCYQHFRNFCTRLDNCGKIFVHLCMIFGNSYYICEK